MEFEWFFSKMIFKIYNELFNLLRKIEQNTVAMSELIDFYSVGDYSTILKNLGKASFVTNRKTVFKDLSDRGIFSADECDKDINTLSLFKKVELLEGRYFDSDLNDYEVFNKVNLYIHEIIAVDIQKPMTTNLTTKK